MLDGFIMLTEKDEFIYHEMVTAVPMAVNPEIKKVLVIGAGDGGTIRELCRYNTIEKIDMVEIDEQVVNVCKEYLPQTACAFDDPRLTLYIEDGLKFVRRKENEYDLIIVVQPTRLDREMDFLQKNFTATAQRRSQIREY